MREVVGRDTKLDNVKKFQICFSVPKDDHIESFAIALRKSGNCDFYYQLAKVASYEQKVAVPDEEEDLSKSTRKRPKLDFSVPIFDVDCSFDQTYVTFGKDQNNNDIVMGVNHALQSRVSPEEADRIENYNFSNIFY